MPIEAWRLVCGSDSVGRVCPAIGVANAPVAKCATPGWAGAEQVGILELWACPRHAQRTTYPELMSS